MADLKEYAFLLLIWLIPTILLRALFRTRNTSLRLPSPLALPILGHIHLLGPLLHQTLYKLSNQYGPLFGLSLGSVTCIVVSSPEVAKEILRTHDISFSDRPKIGNVEYLTYGAQDFSFSPYGAYWRFMKKLCMSELLGARTLDLLLPISLEEKKRLMGLISRKAESGLAMDVRAEVMAMTNSVISRMIMSKGCTGSEDEAGKVRKLINEMNELSGKFNLSDFFWFCKDMDLQGFGKRLKEVRDRFDGMMERIIQEHQEARKKQNQVNNGDQRAKDLLDILLDISEDGNSEIRLTMENIKGSILDLYSGGTDTTAMTIEWALAELINHPDAMEKAVQEIVSAVTGKNNRLVAESDIANLPYLQAVVKETLRLHPASPIIHRQSSEDCSVEGYHIPAKTRLFLNVWAINRSPEHWEKPHEFKPERFLNEEGRMKGQLDVRGQHFHYMPFGSGRRSCPGISLALQVVQTTLAAMIQCFEWKVDGKVDMEEGPGMLLGMANPLKCYPVARLNPLPSM